MNPKIRKVIDDIERTKDKIAELQVLLPELERKRIDMENAEIIKLVRSASILPSDLPAFLESLKTPKESVSVPALTIQREDEDSRFAKAKDSGMPDPEDAYQPNQYDSDDDGSAGESDDDDYQDDGGFNVTPLSDD